MAVLAIRVSLIVYTRAFYAFSCSISHVKYFTVSIPEFYLKLNVTSLLIDAHATFPIERSHCIYGHVYSKCHIVTVIQQRNRGTNTQPFATSRIKVNRSRYWTLGGRPRRDGAAANVKGQARSLSASSFKDAAWDRNLIECRQQIDMNSIASVVRHVHCRSACACLRRRRDLP